MPRVQGNSLSWPLHMFCQNPASRKSGGIHDNEVSSCHGNMMCFNSFCNMWKAFWEKVNILSMRDRPLENAVKQDTWNCQLLFTVCEFENCQRKATERMGLWKRNSWHKGPSEEGPAVLWTQPLCVTVSKKRGNCIAFSLWEWHVMCMKCHCLFLSPLWGHCEGIDAVFELPECSEDKCHLALKLKILELLQCNESALWPGA